MNSGKNNFKKNLKKGNYSINLLKIKSFRLYRITNLTRRKISRNKFFS